MRAHLISIVICLACCASACATTQSNAPASEPAASSETEAAPANEPVVASETSPSFARCERGACHFDMTLGLASTADGEIRVARCIPPRPACGENVGRLTEAGLAAARTAREALAAESLDARYGCPGCTDGPRYKFTVSHAGAAPSQHVYDPTRPTQLPKALLDAHRLFDASVHAVMLCKPNAEVELVGECKHD